LSTILSNLVFNGEPVGYPVELQIDNQYNRRITEVKGFLDTTGYYLQGTIVDQDINTDTTYVNSKGVDHIAIAGEGNEIDDQFYEENLTWLTKIVIQLNSKSGSTELRSIFIAPKEAVIEEAPLQAQSEAVFKIVSKLDWFKLYCSRLGVDVLGTNFKEYKALQGYSARPRELIGQMFFVVLDAKSVV
jgi:hypothetical protein